MYCGCGQCQCSFGEIILIHKTWNRDCTLSVNEVLSECLYDERISIAASFLDLDEESPTANTKQLHFATYLHFPILDYIFRVKKGIPNADKKLCCLFLSSICGKKFLVIKIVIN
jgi:hypothetical protein